MPVFSFLGNERNNMYTLDFDIAFTPFLRWQLIGAYVLLTVFFTARFHIRRRVRIYSITHLDKIRYIGSSRLRKTFGGYEIYISEKILKKAYTDMFMIRTDEFYLGDDIDRITIRCPDGVATGEKADEIRFVYPS